MKNIFIKASNDNLSYRNLMNRIGIAMLSLVAAMFLLNEGLYLILSGAMIFWDLPQNDQAVIFEFIDAITYMITFLVPIVIFRCISKNKGFSDIRFEFKFSLDLIPIMLAALAICRVASVLNSYYFFSSGETMLPIKPEAESLFVNILSIALVPAVCEELLFRGLVLENLRPYGKITAVIGSSVLFGLMHMNSYQFFYTTIAGILIGIIYLKTESVFAPMIFHFINNALAVVDEFVEGRADDTVAFIYNSASLLAIIVIGMVSTILLLKRKKKKPETLNAGYFERNLPEGRFYSEITIGTPSLISGFLTPTNLAFMIIAAAIGFSF